MVLNKVAVSIGLDKKASKPASLAASLAVVVASAVNKMKRVSLSAGWVKRYSFSASVPLMPAY